MVLRDPKILAAVAAPLLLGSFALATDNDIPRYEPTRHLLDASHPGYQFENNQVATLAYVAPKTGKVSATQEFPPVPWYCPRTLDHMRDAAHVTEDVQFELSQRVFFPGMGLAKQGASGSLSTAMATKTQAQLVTEFGAHHYDEKCDVSGDHAGCKTAPEKARYAAVRWCYEQATCIGFEWDTAESKAVFRQLKDIALPAASAVPYGIVEGGPLGHMEGEGDHVRVGVSNAKFVRMSGAAAEAGTYLLCDLFVDLKLVLNKHHASAASTASAHDDHAGHDHRMKSRKLSGDDENLFLEVYDWQRIFEESSLYGKVGQNKDTLEQIVNYESAAVKTERNGTHNLLPVDGWVQYRGKYGWYNAEMNGKGVVLVKHTNKELAAAKTANGFDETEGLREKTAWGLFDTHQNPHGVHAGSGGYLLPHRMWEYRFVGNYELGLSWYAGEAVCQKLGGHMMKITQEDDAFLAAMLTKEAHDAWAGEASHDHAHRNRKLSGDAEPLSPWLGLVEQPASKNGIDELVKRLDAMAGSLEWKVEKQFTALAANDPNHFWTYCWATQESKAVRQLAGGELHEDDHDDHEMRGTDEHGHSVEETKPWLDIASCFDAELARNYEVLDSIHQSLDVLKGYGRQFAWVHGKGELSKSWTGASSSNAAARTGVDGGHAGHDDHDDHRKLSGDDAQSEGEEFDITPHLPSFGEFLRFGHNQPDMRKTGSAQGCFYASHGYAFYDTECHAPEQKRPVICAREVSYKCEYEKAHAGHDHRQRRQLRGGHSNVLTAHEKKAAVVVRSRLARAVASREQRGGLRRLHALWSKVAKAQKSLKAIKDNMDDQTKTKSRNALVVSKNPRALSADDHHDAIPSPIDNNVCRDPLYEKRSAWASHFSSVYKSWLEKVTLAFDTWDEERRGKQGSGWMNEWHMGGVIEPRETDKLAAAGVNQLSKPWVLTGTYQIPLASASEAVLDKIRSMLAARAAAASGGGHAGHDDHSGHDDHRALSGEATVARDDAFEALVTEHINEAVWRRVASWSTLWDKELGRLGESGVLYEEARIRYLDIYNMDEVKHDDEDDHAGHGHRALAEDAAVPLSTFAAEQAVLPAGYPALTTVFASERSAVNFHKMTLHGDFKLRVHNQAIAKTLAAQVKAMKDNSKWRCMPSAFNANVEISNCAQEFASAWHRAYDAIKSRVRGYGEAFRDRIWIWDESAANKAAHADQGFRVTELSLFKTGKYRVTGAFKINLSVAEAVHDNAAKLQQIKDYFNGASGKTELAHAVAGASGAAEANIEVTSVKEVTRMARARALSGSDFYNMKIGFAIKKLPTTVSSDRMARKIGTATFATRLSHQLNDEALVSLRNTMGLTSAELKVAEDGTGVPALTSADIQTDDDLQASTGDESDTTTAAAEDDAASWNTYSNRPRPDNANYESTPTAQPTTSSKDGDKEEEKAWYDNINMSIAVIGVVLIGAVILQGVLLLLKSNSGAAKSKGDERSSDGSNSKPGPQQVGSSANENVTSITVQGRTITLNEGEFTLDPVSGTIVLGANHPVFTGTVVAVAGDDAKSKGLPENTVRGQPASSNGNTKKKVSPENSAEFNSADDIDKK